jgi:uncharacterized membrane-anchored protein
MLLVLAAWIVSPTGTCHGDQQPLVPLAPESGWTMGPAQASLGNFATINVPEGYRFLDANGARALLQNMKNPVPRGLAGILVPNSGKWWALFEYQKPGYIKTTKEDSIDAAAVLAVVQERLKNQNVDRAKKALAPITTVSWEMEPVFDAAKGIIEWSYTAETVTGPVRNQTVRMLGRRGYLDVTAVQSSQGASETVSLKEVMGNVSFVEGERYSDYIRGDDIASLSLTELITYDGKLPQTTSLFARAGFWVGALAAMIVAAGVAALLIVRRAKRKKAKRSPLGTNGHVNGSYRNGSEIGLLKTLFGHNGHHHPRAKRTFNYHKYYSDLMSQVSYGSYGTVPFVNGNGVKRTNGESAEQASRNGHTALPIQHSQMTLFSGADLVGELIANQKSLIEEQKRLLQQQTKLIEEKTRLIEEKSKMMEQQSDLIGSNLL